MSGVLGGLSDYMKVDSGIVRVSFVALTLFFAGFPGVIFYIVLAAILPRDIDLQEETDNNIYSTDIMLDKSEDVKKEKEDYSVYL